MKLVWHIVRKDLRRFAVPLAVWNTFVLLSNVGFRVATPHWHGNIPTAVDIWVQELAISSALLTGIDLVLASVLAGAFVLEDPVMGSNEFWPTRPIAPRVLLTAKAVTAIGALVIAPTLLLLPVWLSVAQLPVSIARAALHFVLWHGVVVCAAFAFASVVLSFAEWVFASVLVVLAAVAVGAAGVVPLPARVMAGFSDGRTRFMLVAAAVVLAGVAILAFMRRRPRPAWALLFIGLVACGGITRWYSPSARPLPAPARPATRAEMAAVRVHATMEAPRRTGGGRWQFWPVDVVVTTRRDSPFVLAPAFVRAADGSRRSMPDWGEYVAAHLLAPANGSSVLQWHCPFNTPLFVRPVRSVPSIRGASVEMWRARLSIVGDVPLVVGRSSASNAGILRVISVQRLAGDAYDLFFEERAIGRRPAGEAKFVGRKPSAASVYDAFCVMGRDGTARPLFETNPKSGWMNSQRVTYRHYVLDGQLDPASQHLVHVRIVIEDKFLVPFVVPAAGESVPKQAQR